MRLIDIFHLTVLISFPLTFNSMPYEYAKQDQTGLDVILKPGSIIDTQTILYIHIKSTKRQFEFNNPEQLITISQRYEKYFMYHPQTSIITLNLKNFKVFQLSHKHLEIICKFDFQTDGDTHWEVFWKVIDDLGQSYQLPMTSFFVKTNIPVSVEMTCKKVFGRDCNNLVENQFIILTCFIKTGMPGIEIYIKVPEQPPPKYLIKQDRIIKVKLKLSRISLNRTVECGAFKSLIQAKQQLNFKLNPPVDKRKIDLFVHFTVISIFSIMVIIIIVFGPCAVLMKPRKDTTKLQVTFFMNNMYGSTSEDPFSMATAVHNRMSWNSGMISNKKHKDDNPNLNHLSHKKRTATKVDSRPKSKNKS